MKAKGQSFYLKTKDGKMPEFTWKAMSRGAGSQFIMSIPHGALNYAATEVTFLFLLSPLSYRLLIQW